MRRWRPGVAPAQLSSCAPQAGRAMHTVKAKNTAKGAQMATKDIAEKHLVEYNDIFCDLVNMAFYKGEPVIKPETLEDRQARELIHNKKKIAEIERDVCKIYKKAQVELAILGIENQTAPDKYMPIRVMEYNAAAYRSQLEELEEKKRKEIIPVITLVVYFGTIPWKKYLSLHEIVNLPAEFKRQFNDYRIKVLPLAFLSEKQIASFKTADMRELANYLRQKRLHKDYEASRETLGHFRGIVRVISALAGDKDIMKAYNTMLSEGKEPTNMCEMIQKLKDDSKEEGFKLGRAEGKAEGRAEGVLETLFALVKKGLLSLDDAAKQAGISKAKVQKLMPQV